MARDVRLFLQDILENIKDIKNFSKGIVKADLKKDIMRQKAIVRSIEIIGEAVKNIPDSLKNKHLEIPWRKIAGTRDLIIHAYFGVDLDVAWKIIQEDIIDLEPKIQKILNDSENFKI